MRERFRSIVLFAIFIAVVAWAGLKLAGRIYPAAPPFIRYRITCRDRSLEVVTVSIRIFGPGGARTAFCVPDANEKPPEPIQLSAIDVRGDTLDVVRGGDRWVVQNGDRDFTVTYDLTLTVEDRYTPEINDMLTMLDVGRGRIMGRNVFIVPECGVARGVLVDVHLHPRSAPRSAWRSNAGRIIVPSIEDLPLTIAATGDYRLLESTVGGTEVKLAIAGDWSFTDRELFDLICRIVLQEISLFDTSPHDSYLFVCDRNPVRTRGSFDSFGVHFARNMVLLLDRRLDRSDLFDTPVSIIAHEFFHNWNGDAIRPASDAMLWFTEGATVYYSYRVLLDINAIVSLQYEARRDEIARRYRDNPYRRSVAISRAVNSDLTDRDMVNLLYDGGFLAAELLDRRLAELTGGSVHLIDVLRSLYRNGTDGGDLDEAALCAAIRRVSGFDLSSFIDELIHVPAPPALDRPVAAHPPAAAKPAYPPVSS